MGMGPTRKQTPRTGLEDAVTQLLTGGLQQAGGPSVTSGKGGNKVTGGPATLQDIYNNLSTPSYGGPLTAPTDPLQKGGMAAVQSGLDALPDFQNLGRDITSGLQGVAGASMAPSSLMNLLQNRPGTDILQGLNGPGGAIGELTKLGSEGGGDFAGILAAMNKARQGSLSDDLRNVSERFSESGLRNSTDLAASLGDTSNRSEANWLSQASQLIPQITSARTGALSAAGQLGLGAGSALQQGGLQAGDILSQLFQGQQGRGLQALQTLPGVAQLFANLPGQVGSGAYNVGAAQQGQDTAGMQAKLQEFIRTNGAFLAPILNFAAGAPQISGPGKGSQLLQGGATIGAAAL